MQIRLITLVLLSMLCLLTACKSTKQTKILADYHILILLQDDVKPSYLQVKFPYYKPINERPSSKSQNRWINTYRMYQEDALKFVEDLNKDKKVIEANFAVGVKGQKKVISSTGKRSTKKVSPKN